MSGGNVIPFGCRPSRIASTRSGARSVSRSTHEMQDELLVSAAVTSLMAPERPVDSPRPDRNAPPP
jgi:hypothetical protein